VADRFHVLSNLADTLLAVFEQHAKQLHQASRLAETNALPPSLAEGTSALVSDEVLRVLPPPTPSPKQQTQTAQRRAVRL
jgi:hypothetical protein